MSEPAVRREAWTTHACSERLSRAVAGMAARIAELLRALPSAERDLASACAFLESLTDPTDYAVAFLQQTYDGTDPIDRLVDAYGFTSVDRDLLILAGMAEENEGIASVLATLHPASEPRASAGLAAQLFGRTHAERRTLREHLEIGGAITSGAIRLSGDGPLFTRTLDIAPALWSALHGLDAWPAGLAPDETPVSLRGLGDWLESREIQRAAAAMAAGDRRYIFVVAENADTAGARAAALATHADVPSARLTLTAAHSADARRFAELHVVARGVLPILVLAPPPEDARPTDAPLPFERFPGPVVLCAVPGPRPSASRPMQEIAVEGLSPRGRVAMWREVLPELAADAERLSAAYAVEPTTAVALAADARALAALEQRAVTSGDLADSVRARGQIGWAPGITLRRARATWQHLVLAPDRLAQLQEVMHRLTHQSRVLDDWGFLHGRGAGGTRGVKILLAGAPGTGKTLAAEVLAHAIGVDLLVVDLSKVVSRWLGETEKHLSAVFDAAERTQAVLLFDEADALFGRRTEVTDANDRYANLETAYLLTRLERFEGLAVLSTNLQRNLDPAFLRRLEFVITFDEPSVRERADLWRCHIPSTAPLASDVDVDEIAAMYPIVGGLIRNAAVAAAFQAAQARSPITRALIVRAIRREYQKSGRAFPGAPPGMNDS